MISAHVVIMICYVPNAQSGRSEQLGLCRYIDRFFGQENGGGVGPKLTIPVQNIRIEEIKQKENERDRALIQEHAFTAVHSYEFDTVTILRGEDLLVLENEFGRQDEERPEALVAELGAESKRVREQRKAERQSVSRAKKEAERMREAVEEVEDEGEIEPTPICVVHVEFRIDEESRIRFAA